MKQTRKKLLSRAGDSIAEVLVALLISAVALVMLASMITSSTHLIERSRSQLGKYYVQNNELTERETTAETDTITLKQGDVEDSTYQVYIIENDKGGGNVYAYKEKQP